MKTITELEQELLDLEKCIRFETERKALKWYIVEYIECYWEILEIEHSLFWQLN